MAITLDTIRSLDASKTYYIANSTGEIKEAGAWQKFKCFFGIGDGRAKAAKLVEAVKNALLDSLGKISDAALGASVRNLESTRSRLFSVSGRAIAELASTFTAANAANIARIQAGQVAKRPLEEAVKNVQTALLLGDERVDDVMEVMKRAAQPVIDDPPMKTDATGHRVLDEEAFTKELANVLEDAERTVTDVSKAGPTGRARFDVAVRDMMFATLYGLDGELPPETLRKALALACNGEGTRGNFLGLFDGTLLLSTFIPLEDLTAETLGGRILAFADAAHAVRDALAAPASEQTASGGVSGEAFFLQA